MCESVGYVLLFGVGIDFDGINVRDVNTVKKL